MNEFEIDDIELDDVDEKIENIDEIYDLDNESVDNLDLDEDFIEWKNGITADLDEATLKALYKDADKRNPYECEMVDAVYNSEYETQKIFKIDEVSNEVLRDENGLFVSDTSRSKGTQVPDEFYEDEDGIYIREVKDYHDADNLIANIKSQTYDRYTAFGDDIDLTYVVAPNFSIHDADRIQMACDALDVNIEWLK